MLEFREPPTDHANADALLLGFASQTLAEYCWLGFRTERVRRTKIPLTPSHFAELLKAGSLVFAKVIDADEDVLKPTMPEMVIDGKQEGIKGTLVLKLIVTKLLSQGSGEERDTLAK